MDYQSELATTLILKFIDDCDSRGCSLTVEGIKYMIKSYSEYEKDRSNIIYNAGRRDEKNFIESPNYEFSIRLIKETTKNE
jgi:hypothetical protein